MSRGEKSSGRVSSIDVCESMTINRQFTNWNTYTYAKNADVVAHFGKNLIDVLDPKKGESILDLGCGNGDFTELIQKAGCHTVGIDNNEKQVAEAKKKGIECLFKDAEELDYYSCFDGVYSNALLHWIPNAGAVLRGIYRALKPGGRFVANFGASGNLKNIHQALHKALVASGKTINPHPWFFPTKEEYEALLIEHHFDIAFIKNEDRLTELDMEIGAAWLRTYMSGFTAQMSDEDKTKIEDLFFRQLETEHTISHGRLILDYKRLQLKVFKPSPLL